MVIFLVLTAVTFSLFGFLIGIWADGFEKLQVVPVLIYHPARLLGRKFLLDQDTTRILAKGVVSKPCGLSD